MQLAIATHYNVLDCQYSHAITDSAVTDQIIEKVAGDVVDIHKDSETVESQW